MTLPKSVRHRVSKLILLSGDREPEVCSLADKIGIQTAAYGARSPEERVELVRKETAKSRTAFVGDGINDGPAFRALRDF
jgi:P-type E1-E2 ATPase